jgi:hypothetical protein
MQAMHLPTACTAVDAWLTLRRLRFAMQAIIVFRLYQQFVFRQQACTGWRAEAQRPVSISPMASGCMPSAAESSFTST